MSGQSARITNRTTLKVLAALREQIAHCEEMEETHRQAWIRAAEENHMLRERCGIDPMRDLAGELKAWKGKKAREKQRQASA